MGVSATNRRSEIAEEEQRGPSGDVDGGGGRDVDIFKFHAATSWQKG